MLNKQWDLRFNPVIVSDRPIECIVTGFVGTEVPGLLWEENENCRKMPKNQKFKLELLTKSCYWWDHFPKTAFGTSTFVTLVMSITVFPMQILRVDLKYGYTNSVKSSFFPKLMSLIQEAAINCYF